MSNETVVTSNKDGEVIYSAGDLTNEVVKELKQITKELKRHNEKMDWLEQAISRLANNL